MLYEVSTWSKGDEVIRGKRWIHEVSKKQQEVILRKLYRIMDSGERAIGPEKKAQPITVQ